LRFSHRGLVACASFGKNQNGSQFFITLGPTPELDKKNTIFGKITGNTLYNLLNMNTFDIDDDERPLKPPIILRAEILWNPFEDIVPRNIKPKEEEELKPVEEKPKPASNKKLALLSFADEAEEDENIAINFKPISSVSSNHLPKKSWKRTREKLLEDDEPDNDEPTDKPKEEKPEDITPWIPDDDPDPERDKIREQTEQIISELRSKNKKIEPAQKKAASEAKELLRKQREKYVKRGKKTEVEIMSAFETFRTKIHSGDMAEWRGHQLNFEKDVDEIKVKDPTLQYDDDGGLIVFDPLKDYKPKTEERHLNKHQQRLRAKKNLEKW